MHMCRTCLKTPAEKDISELEMGLKESNKSCFEIMMFCLEIKVNRDSRTTRKLCSACYEKIISFYNFKSLSLKNDTYLKSLDPVIVLEKGTSEYGDANGVKHENFLHDVDCGQCKTETENEIKFETETKIKIEITVEDIQEVTENDELVTPELCGAENVKQENIGTEENAPVPKNHGKPKKTSEQGYKVCKECGKSVGNLKLHMAQHVPKSERKKFQCEKCTKVFSTKDARRKHHKTAHLGIKYKCDVCAKEVTHLRLHKALVHNREVLQHACMLCGHQFWNKSSLANHMISHTKGSEDATTYECSVCHVKFDRKGVLSRHMRRVHEQERKFQCEFCSKSFFSNYALERHIRSHKNERPCKCEECGKSFSSPSVLRKHQIIHTGAKDFRCHVCDKAFSRPEYIPIHMVTHTKEKKHPCRYCGRSFGRADHRRNHELATHEKHLNTD